MRLTSFASAFVIAAVMAVTISSVHASDKSAPDGATAAPKTSTAPVVATSQFATLKGVKAVPMASKELEAVKGQHVHFDDASAGIRIHLAGRLDEKNWSNEWGGSDDQAVAPSYKGLCKAAGLTPVGSNGGGAGQNGSGISIPLGQFQCPL